MEYRVCVWGGQYLTENVLTLKDTGNFRWVQKKSHWGNDILVTGDFHTFAKITLGIRNIEIIHWERVLFLCEHLR